MSHYLPPSSHGHQSPTNHYNSVGSMEHMYQELEQEYDQTPPPPYPDYEEPNWPDNNNHSNNSNLPYPVQRVQSESSESINRPVGSGSGMHQSHSHQSISMRSTASNPAGYQSIKKNFSNFLPHHGMSGQYLSSSTSQISKMRRHSSGAYQTSITDDGSGNLTSVTEV